MSLPRQMRKQLVVAAPRKHLSCLEPQHLQGRYRFAEGLDDLIFQGLFVADANG